VTERCAHAGLDGVVAVERLVAALQRGTVAVKFVATGRAAAAGGRLAECVRRVVIVAERRALAGRARVVERRLVGAADLDLRAVALHVPRLAGRRAAAILTLIRQRGVAERCADAGLNHAQPRAVLVAQLEHAGVRALMLAGSADGRQAHRRTGGAEVRETAFTERGRRALFGRDEARAALRAILELCALATHLADRTRRQLAARDLRRRQRDLDPDRPVRAQDEARVQCRVQRLIAQLARDTAIERRPVLTIVATRLEHRRLVDVAAITATVARSAGLGRALPQVRVAVG